MTQADKVRAMTDEKMAHYFSELLDACPGGTGCSGKSCYDCWFDQLTQEIQTSPQKEPLCLSCAHANISVTDDFADCLCAVRGGYEGGKTECKDYERKQRNDESTL